MAEQAGLDMALLINTTESTYVAVGGLRNVSSRWNNQPIDITHADSANMQTLLGGGGTSSLEISADGLFVDDVAYDTIEATARARTLKGYRLQIPVAAGGATFHKLEASFMVSSFEVSGRYDDAVAFSITLASSGAVTYTAAGA